MLVTDDIAVINRTNGQLKKNTILILSFIKNSIRRIAFKIGSYLGD